MPKILFVTYGGGHADLVRRLLRHLDPSSEVVKPTVLALTTAKPALAGSWCHLRTPLDYIDTPDYATALDVGAELSKPFWDASTGITWEESCAYMGVSMLDLEADLGREAVAKYETEGRNAFTPQRFLKKVLEREQPDLVVTTCNVRMERAATLAGLEMGIPTARIEDLFAFSMIGLHTYGERGVLIPQEEWPDFVIVPNPAIKANLQSHGFPQERILPLGQPVFSDWQSSYAEVDPLPALEDWRQDPRPVLTYLTHVHSDIFIEQTKAWCALAPRRPDWLFCIKPHPSIGEATLKALMPEPLENLRIIANAPVEAVIKATDVAVLHRSTTGILCVIAGTPFLVWDTTDVIDFMPFVPSGAAQLVDDDANLEQALSDAIEGKGTPKETPPVLVMPKGASTAIWDTLWNIAAKGKE